MEPRLGTLRGMWWWLTRLRHHEICHSRRSRQELLQNVPPCSKLQSSRNWRGTQWRITTPGQLPGCPLDCPGCPALRLITHSMCTLMLLHGQLPWLPRLPFYSGYGSGGTTYSRHWHVREVTARACGGRWRSWRFFKSWGGAFRRWQKRDRETSFLFQRLSNALQKGNATCMLGSFPIPVDPVSD